MKSPLCRLATCVLALAACAAAATAAPPDAAWEAVDKILGRPGKDLPGDVHKYGWPRSGLSVTIDGVKVEPACRAAPLGGCRGKAMSSPAPLRGYACR